MDDITLLHGDCFEWMKEMPDGSVDMILTDPPYGVTCCAWDNVQPFELMWGGVQTYHQAEWLYCYIRR